MQVSIWENRWMCSHELRDLWLSLVLDLRAALFFPFPHCLRRWIILWVNRFHFFFGSKVLHKSIFGHMLSGNIPNTFPLNLHSCLRHNGNYVFFRNEMHKKNRGNRQNWKCLRWPSFKSRQHHNKSSINFTMANFQVFHGNTFYYSCGRMVGNFFGYDNTFIHSVYHSWMVNGAYFSWQDVFCMEQWQGVSEARKCICKNWNRIWSKVINSSLNKW